MRAWNHCPLTYLPRYGAITFGNIQKSIPVSFGARAPVMVRKIAVRRAAQVSRGPRPRGFQLWPRGAGGDRNPQGSHRLCVSPGFLQQQGLPQHAHLPQQSQQCHPARQPAQEQGQPGSLWCALVGWVGWGQAGGRQQVPEAAFPCAVGITVTNHPMNKTSASLSLDYLCVWGPGGQGVAVGWVPGKG